MDVKIFAAQLTMILNSYFYALYSVRTCNQTEREIRMERPVGVGAPVKVWGVDRLLRGTSPVLFQWPCTLSAALDVKESRYQISHPSLYSGVSGKVAEAWARMKSGKSEA